VDLCAEGLAWLLAQDTDIEGRDTWTRRAVKNRERNTAAMGSPEIYSRPDAYARAVRDLNRALYAAGSDHSALHAAPGKAPVVSLADYQDPSLSPLRRSDLLAASKAFQTNPFFPFYRLRFGELMRESSTFGTVGISLNYLSQALCTFALIGFLRSAYPGTRIILGGALVNSWTAQGCLDPEDDFDGLVDRVLSGRGEDALAAYLRLEGRAEWATPDFDDFMHLSYFAPVRILPYNFSIGCPWKRCTFCPETAENAPYRTVSANRAATEIASLVERYAPGLLHFTDNELSPVQLSGLAAHPPGPRWYGFARFSRELLDPTFCASLAAAGCAMLQLGLESGDQAVLDALGKGTNISEIERILFNLKSSGIRTFIYILFGTPAEDYQAACATRDFVALHADKIDFLNTAIFNMPASGSQAAALATKTFYEGDLSLYRDFVHPSGWSRRKVREFIAGEFESDPRIKPILRRCPPIFTSNHAAFR
jgi:hypothetical protein